MACGLDALVLRHCDCRSSYDPTEDCTPLVPAPPQDVFASFTSTLYHLLCALELASLFFSKDRVPCRVVGL
uniref:Uncharacterized protein n=1 Tax=Physcomitrium patens TaxID=3218 RepID=A0A2K1KA47_PHYPA|nr:hypothetical protein PHYPA_009830 [Physcomitrium patens]